MVDELKNEFKNMKDIMEFTVYSASVTSKISKEEKSKMKTMDIKPLKH